MKKKSAKLLITALDLTIVFVILYVLSNPRNKQLDEQSDQDRVKNSGLFNIFLSKDEGKSTMNSDDTESSISPMANENNKITNNNKNTYNEEIRIFHKRIFYFAYPKEYKKMNLKLLVYNQGSISRIPDDLNNLPYDRSSFRMFPYLKNMRGSQQYGFSEAGTVPGY